VADFHCLVGLFAVFVAISAFLNPASFILGDMGNIKLASLIEMSIGAAVGAITFSGSIIAFLKLRGIMSGAPITFSGQHILNLILGISIFVLIFYLCKTQSTNIFWTVIIISFLVGVLLIIPIGGADMPVVISLLNSYSGIAAAAAGFVVESQLLIVAGAMVGAAGLILTQVMCKGMNRSLISVLFGGTLASKSEKSSGGGEYTNITSCSVEECALTLEAANKVIIVPGYGLAVAQAQHTLREVAKILEQNEIEVCYAIHPVAGRMPGHMNVLLAEADVPYEQLKEMDIVNPDFPAADVVLVLGANDVVNPQAKSDKNSPLYGMPVLDVQEARTVFVIKRGMSAGYSGIKNDLFDLPNTSMVFGDAKKVLSELMSELKELGVGAK